jgi:hypothetical protein
MAVRVPPELSGEEGDTGALLNVGSPDSLLTLVHFFSQYSSISQVVGNK